MNKLFIILLVILFSCNNKNTVPNGILKPDKMQKVLWNILQADAFANDYLKKDTTKNVQIELAKLQQLIFKNNNITKQDYYKSIEFYNLHPLIYQPLLDTMINKATREKYAKLNAHFKTDSIKVQ